MRVESLGGARSARSGLRRVVWGWLLLGAVAATCSARGLETLQVLERPIDVQQGRRSNPYRLDPGSADRAPQWKRLDFPPAPCSTRQPGPPKVWREDPVVVTYICLGEGGAAESKLVGRSTDGRTWVRDLRYRLGGFSFDEQVLGADSAGILTSRFAVVSPVDGSDLIKAPLKLLESEAREVPIVDIVGAGAKLRGARKALVFSGEASLFSRRGGWHLADLVSGAMTLVQPIEASLTGDYWAPVALASHPSSNALVIVEKKATRGPGPMRLRTLDMGSMGWSASIDLADDALIDDVRLVVTPQRIGVSFIDLSRGAVRGMVLPTP